VVAWIIAAMRHRGPFPILVVNGEAGAGKSTFTRLVRSLLDPSAAPIRAVPRDDRDLVVSASNSWVLAFDNLSAVPVWLMRSAGLQRAADLQPGCCTLTATKCCSMLRGQLS
jgi:putative DNA primase/helicase